MQTCMHTHTNTTHTHERTHIYVRHILSNARKHHSLCLKKSLFCYDPCVPFSSSRVLFVSRCKIRARILRVKMAERVMPQARITNVNVPMKHPARVVNVCSLCKPNLNPNLVVLYISVCTLLVCIYSTYYTYCSLLNNRCLHNFQNVSILKLTERPFTVRMIPNGGPSLCWLVQPK